MRVISVGNINRTGPTVSPVRLRVTFWLALRAIASTAGLLGTRKRTSPDKTFTVATVPTRSRMKIPVSLLTIAAPTQPGIPPTSNCPFPNCKQSCSTVMDDCAANRATTCCPCCKLTRVSAWVISCCPGATGVPVCAGVSSTRTRSPTGLTISAIFTDGAGEFAHAKYAITTTPLAALPTSKPCAHRRDDPGGNGGTVRHFPQPTLRKPIAAIAIQSGQFKLLSTALTATHPDNRRTMQQRVSSHDHDVSPCFRCLVS